MMYFCLEVRIILVIQTKPIQDGVYCINSQRYIYLHQPWIHQKKNLLLIIFKAKFGYESYL